MQNSVSVVRRQRARVRFRRGRGAPPTAVRRLRPPGVGLVSAAHRPWTARSDALSGVRGERARAARCLPVLRGGRRPGRRHRFTSPGLAGAAAVPRHAAGGRGATPGRTTCLVQFGRAPGRPGGPLPRSTPSDAAGSLAITAPPTWAQPRPSARSWATGSSSADRFRSAPSTRPSTSSYFRERLPSMSSPTSSIGQ